VALGSDTTPTGMLVGGDFTQIANGSRGRVARLNASGGFDSTFNPSSGAENGTVFAVALQSDGKVLIGGSFTKVNGVDRNRIARLDSNGTLDTDFLSDDPENEPDLVGVTGQNGIVRALLLQPDGKILVGGNFTQVNGTTRNRIVRLLPARGHLDATFRPGPLSEISQYGPNNNEVLSLALQTNEQSSEYGLIVLGGSFTAYNVPGLTAGQRIVRIGGL
jgi:uncharacterized delta-60 repeat protein